MNKAFYKIIIALLLSLTLFSSCVSNNSTGEVRLQTLSRDRRTTLDNMRTELYRESLTYASKQMATLSITANELFEKDSAILKHKSEIPLLESRIERFTGNLQTTLESSISEIADGLFTTLKRYTVQNRNFNYFYEEELSFLGEATTAFSKQIDSLISEVLDKKLSENNLYEEWMEILDTYDIWRLHYENLYTIGVAQTYEKQQPISLLTVSENFIKRGFIENLKVGERITKESYQGGWKNSINMLY